MSEDDPTFENVSRKVKIRDNHKCQAKLGITDKRCHKEHWITKDDGTRICALRVVRINPAKPDRKENLMTVCRKHVPDWE